MSDFKTEYKYRQVLKAIGLSPEEMEGLTPDEIKLKIAFVLELQKTKKNPDDVLMSSPLTIVLGGVKYDIKPLTIREDNKWRKKMGELFGKYLGKQQELTVDTDPNALMVQLLPILMSEGLDDIVELFFLYAKDLDKEEIETTCPSTEVISAAMEVFEFTLPLAMSIIKMLMKLQAKQI